MGREQLMVEYELIEDNKYVSVAEVRKLFNGAWDAADSDPNAQPNSPTGTIVEIDDELGLELVSADKETIQSKYGCPPLDTNNSFHNSLQRQFDERGHLSPKQVNCLMKPRY